MKMKYNDIDNLLKNLPETIDEFMPNIKASSKLKSNILEEAYYSNFKNKKTKFSFNFRIAFSSLIAIATLFVVIIGFNKQGNFEVEKQDTNSPLLFSSHTSGSNDISLKSRSMNEEGNNLLTSTFIDEDNTLPAFQSIWSTDLTPFPFVNIKEKIYRLVNTETNNNYVFDNKVAVVETQEETPSLSSKTSSNILNVGTEIYSNDKFKDTFVIANIDNKQHVFQRVSLGGIALIGNENFNNTFSVMNSVKSLNLSGVGIINDSDKIKDLVSILSNKAKYKNANDGSTFTDTLIVELDNGIKLQLLIEDNELAACGTYICPEFFEKFNYYIKNEG